MIKQSICNQAIYYCQATFLTLFHIYFLFKEILKDVWLLKKIIDFNLLQNAPTKTLYSERNIFREYLKSIFVVKKEKKKLCFLFILWSKKKRGRNLLYSSNTYFILSFPWTFVSFWRNIWENSENTIALYIHRCKIIQLIGSLL